MTTATPSTLLASSSASPPSDLPAERRRFRAHAGGVRPVHLRAPGLLNVTFFW